ncbi:MAG: toll/interleukin-1 receptor domain-containing protein [Methanobrevibacter thaueri]|jgi:hypothetical protein|uniref:toll/interleukin-1 receptor domain-containing protein n=1 Tax=Methanobrevibacter thaueri TaxID=190975 RepID=UPI0026EF7814|nr:toll/interleukin-1 receptor domain-containing protein [Methanobrevibacter thaueri]MBE6496168.1 toll/interleukin-1 receptor domain-containing protein [Methanobrevibacter thaueri]
MKAFISHDSRDKERFVKEFAEKLMNKGIDVWYDEWELKLGDSLMKIFEDMPDCDIFITIISKYSINSKWVKEECDSAFIKKIENNMKFIPVILMDENFEIPHYLDHLVQSRIHNIDNYESEFDKIVSDIWGVSKKPPLGDRPKYTSITPIKGFTQLDSLIIQKLGELLHSKNNMFSSDEIIELTNNEFSKEDILESIQVLESDYKLECQYGLGSRFPYTLKLTPSGVIFYSLHYEEDFETYMKDVVSTLLNEKVHSNEEICKKIDCPKFIVNAILEQFLNHRIIKGSKTVDGSIIIYEITGKGRRQLKNFLD